MEATCCRCERCKRQWRVSELDYKNKRYYCPECGKEMVEERKKGYKAVVYKTRDVMGW